MANELDAYTSMGKRTQTKRYDEYTSFGTILRDALESIDVDVDGMITFLEEKGFELEEMQMRHDDEVMQFFDEAGLEAEAEFTDDVEKIQDAVISAVQDWANSLDGPMVKRVQTKRTDEYTTFGTMLRDSLESIDVDVDGMINFLEDKGDELEEMQMRHDDEVMEFFEDAGLEAEAEFTDDVERIEEAVITAIQDWANSLDEYAPMIKRTVDHPNVNLASKSIVEE